MRSDSKSGFTLVELLTAIVIGSLLLLGCVATTLHFVRTGLSMENYYSMESDAQKFNHRFQQDTWTASGVAWTDAQTMLLDTPTGSIVYMHDLQNSSVTRTQDGNTVTLISDVVAVTFEPFDAAGNLLSMSSSDLATLSDSPVKSVRMSITTQTSISKGSSSANQNGYISTARYTLRNKEVI